MTGGPQGQGQGVQVQHPDAGDAGRLGQVGVEGEQRGVLVDRQPDQLGVHLVDTGDGVVEHDDLDAGLTLERLEHLEPAASLGPPRSSPASAKPCSSAITGAVSNSSPCRKPARTTSTMRPSIATEVSTIFG